MVSIRCATEASEPPQGCAAIPYGVAIFFLTDFAEGFFSAKFEADFFLTKLRDEFFLAYCRAN